MLTPPRLILTVLAIFSFLLPHPAFSGSITPQLQGVLAAAAADETIPVIVSFGEQAELRPFINLERSHRRSGVVQALKARAEHSQKDLRALLKQRGKRGVKELWVVNALALEVSPEEVAELAAWPGVASVTLDAEVLPPRLITTAAGPVEDNLAAIQVELLWDLGFRGEGMVIGILDTGVDVRHPDLAPRWRGGSNSWFDPFGEHPDTPADIAGLEGGHGTAVAGILVGGDASGFSIGVAPGAQWIAAKIFNDAGSGTVSAIHAGFQWILDPDGNPATDDAPDVVNNSWSLGDPGFCSETGDPAVDFRADIAALRSAGIAVVFAGGNGGPNPSTSVSPANYPESFAVGAVDTLALPTIRIMNESARGPSACDGTIYPEMVGPGEFVRTSAIPELVNGVPQPTMLFASGTSFAAPHVTGVMALLLQAAPDVSLARLEAALKASALDLGAVGPDNAFGHGLVNALAAHQNLLVNNPPAVPNLITPADGQTGLDTTVTFVWEKSQDPDLDPVSYRVLYSVNPDLSNPVEVIAAAAGPDGLLLAGVGAVAIGMLAFGAAGPVRRRSRVLLAAALLLAGILSVSCGGGGGGGSSSSNTPKVEQVSTTVSGLQPATTYYWQVVAEDGRGGSSPSAIRSFITR